MRARNELDRLAAARPRVLRWTEDVVDVAEEDHMLHQILTSAMAPRPARARTPGRSLGRPHRAGLLASGLAATAVAVSAAVLATGALSSPGGSPSVHPSSSGHRAHGGPSARQVLLAAASAAVVSPDGHGSYWYVKQTSTQPGSQEIQKTWIRRSDRRQWIWDGSKTGYRVVTYPIQPGFSLASDAGMLRQLENLPPIKVRPLRSGRTRSGRLGSAWRRSALLSELTFGQLQRLPVDPAALTAMIIAANRANERTIDGRLAAAGVRATPTPQDVTEFLSLTNLVAALPVPPQVRAAAFRAMATLPGVISLGAVDGGQRLRFGLGGNKSATLVVDPATSQVKETLTVVGVGGEVSSDSVVAQWTSHLPN